jgi:hypothetical protein
MEIRIGPSWVLSPSGVDGYVSEIRRHWFENPYWDYRGAIKKCIDNNIYVIFNQCLGYNKTAPHPEYLPSEWEWRTRIEENVRILQSLGATKNSAEISLINEPTKFFRKENGYGGVDDLIWFVNIAHDQISGRFKLGAGNMEYYDSFILGDWYGNLASKGHYEIDHIHIQNSCDTEAHTKQYTDYAINLANKYGREISCTEAMHTSWDMSGSDYQKLIMQLSYAEKIGCKNFCIICLNLDTQAAGQELDLSKLGEKPCFKINGIDRSKGNYDNLINTANSKHPIPNIEEEEIMEYLRPEELQAVYDMLDLKTPYHVKTPNLYVVGEKNPDKPVTWADIDAMTETQMKALIKAFKLTGALPSNFPDYPDIKYKVDGSWNSNWETYAKSNPK